MKKALTAVLLVTAASWANAQVGLSGKASVWLDNTKVGGASASTIGFEPTSNIAIKASEDLGNGLRARVVVETSLSGNTLGGAGTQLGDRQSTVGLANRVASIDLGRNVHSQFLAVSNNDAFGTLYGSVAGDVHNLRGLRMSQGMFLQLTPVPGVRLNYDRTQNGVSDATAYSAAATLAGVEATVAQFRQGQERSTVLGANTKFGPAQLFYSHSSNDGIAGKSNGNLVGVRYSLSNSLVAKASYGKTNTDVRAYSLGADYSFSKRTEVGIAYRNVNLAGLAADTKQLGLGLTHRF